MLDGFTSYEGNAVLWKVVYDGGVDYVHALNEMVAMQRYLAKYPNRSIKKIERA